VVREVMKSSADLGDTADEEAVELGDRGR